MVCKTFIKHSIQKLLIRFRKHSRTRTNHALYLPVLTVLVLYVYLCECVCMCGCSLLSLQHNAPSVLKGETTSRTCGLLSTQQQQTTQHCVCVCSLLGQTSPDRRMNEPLSLCGEDIALSTAPPPRPLASKRPPHRKLLSVRMRRTGRSEVNYCCVSVRALRFTGTSLLWKNLSVWCVY